VSGDRRADRRVSVCRALIEIRKAIGDGLGFSLCPSPIWDMLLDLYIAHHEQREVYLWPLCIAANAPLSTAHRKIREMEAKGYINRSPTVRDGRRIGITMTNQGLAITARLLDQIAVIAHSIS
jgi:hypothetical protein